MDNNPHTTDEIVNFILNQKGSDLANLSPEGLSEAFDIHKDELDSLTLDDNETSIPKFLNRQKVFMAMETMEKNPNIQTCELATLCGFSNYDVFTSEFSEYFLIDPKKCHSLKEYKPIILQFSKS